MKKHKNHGRVIGTGERIFDVGMTILGIHRCTLPNLLCTDRFLK